MYASGDGIINVLNTKLRAVKQYLNAASVAHLGFGSLATVCPEKDVALFETTGLRIFYNMKTNKFSQKFLPDRILCTETPSRYYYSEIDNTSLAVKIKDITDELDTLLEWQIFFPAGGDEGDAIEFVRRVEDPEYFSIVKPARPPHKPQDDSVADQPLQ